MKRLASLFSLLAIASAIGWAGPAGAGAGDPTYRPFPGNGNRFVSFQCTTFSGTPRRETIYGIDAPGAHRTLPDACTVGSTCGGCADALLNAGYMLDKAFDVTQANGGPYFVFIRQQ